MSTSDDNSIHPDAAIVDDYLYPSDVTAVYAGTTPNTLKQSRCTGELRKGVPTIPFTRQGRSVRYRGRDIKAWQKKYADQTYQRTVDYRQAV